ncbi:MAG TPA: septal ring lytic transglycosylase RlpA family protein [Solirubrobacteraceae bacterium]|nr:septal ring lytic transglycosylase RlpA family protein [Solirubrobacteraceae bacterium]
MLVPAPLALHGGSLARSVGTLVGEVSGGQAQPAAIVENTAVEVRQAGLNVLDGGRVTVTGRLLHAPGAVGHHSPGLARERVVLQVRRPAGWTTLAGARTGRRGRYRLRYRPHRLGSEVVRVRFPGVVHERGSHRRLGLLSVYHAVDASWYGGGGSMACGGWLTSSTLGVANKTLPCGTLVRLRYDGRTVRVPVVDRGPYVAGREYDLTEATKQALGFEGVGVIWATA